MPMRRLVCKAVRKSASPFRARQVTGGSRSQSLGLQAASRDNLLLLLDGLFSGGRFFLVSISRSPEHLPFHSVSVVL